MRPSALLLWPLLLARFLSGARGWATKSQTVFGAQIRDIQAQMRGEYVDREVEAQLGYLWSFPEDSSSNRGLGGGITWAWNPRLCGTMSGRFSENVGWTGALGLAALGSLSCEDYKAALSRAFDKCARARPAHATARDGTPPTSLTRPRVVRPQVVGQ